MVQATYKNGNLLQLVRTAAGGKIFQLFSHYSSWTIY